MPRRDAGRPRGAPVAQAVRAAVLAELAEHGIEGLRVERVARRAEVNKTTVYRRWPTRDALVAGAMESLLVEFATEPDTGDLRSDLRALLDPIATFAATTAGTALLRAALSGTGGELPALATRRIADGTQPLRGVVERAVARGQWRPGVAPGPVVMMAVGAILHRVLLEGAATDPAWLDGVVDVLVDGVRPR